jgi:tetratricopeptide (TPR) repeat protein
VPADNATTPSLEALKAYSMGVETRLKTGDVQAIPLFEHALEIDPNFALAAARLGAIYTNLRDLDKARDYMKRAFARSESLSQPERLFIRAHYHYIVTGRLDEVVGTYQLWMSTYPTTGVAQPVDDLRAREPSRAVVKAPRSGWRLIRCSPTSS